MSETTEEDILLSYRLEHGLPIIGVASIVDNGSWREKIIVRKFNQSSVVFNSIWTKGNYDKDIVFNKYPTHVYFQTWSGFGINFWCSNDKLRKIAQELLDNARRRSELITLAKYEIALLDASELINHPVFPSSMMFHWRKGEILERESYDAHKQVKAVETMVLKYGNECKYVDETKGVT